MVSKLDAYRELHFRQAKAMNPRCPYDVLERIVTAQLEDVKEETVTDTMIAHHVGNQYPPFVEDKS